MSSSLVLQPTSYHHKMAALVKKLRWLHHLTQNECALRGGISTADVQVVEELRPTTIKHWEKRITALERAFDVPLREMVEKDMRSGRSIRVLQLVASRPSTPDGLT